MLAVAHPTTPQPAVADVTAPPRRWQSHTSDLVLPEHAGGGVEQGNVALAITVVVWEKLRAPCMRWLASVKRAKAGTSFCYDIPALSLSTPLLSLKLSCAARKVWTLHGVQFF